MRRTTAIIAEDEPLLRSELREMLGALWPELDVCAESKDGTAAIEALHAHAPDVLFLDIQMPGLSGLDVARAASGRCHVVFVTAYDDYAVAAFEQGVVDYVMKPVTAARLGAAIVRVKERIKSIPANLEDVLAILAERETSGREYLRWISVSRGQNIVLFTVDEVCYFQACNRYTLVATSDSQSLIRKTIRELVDELDPNVFWQVHRSTLVNVNAIASVHRNIRGDLSIRLKSRPETLPVSAQRAYLFRQM